MVVADRHVIHVCRKSKVVKRLGLWNTNSLLTEESEPIESWQGRAKGDPEGSEKGVWLYQMTLGGPLMRAESYDFC